MEYSYDDAGRTTEVSVYRVIQGSPQPAAYTWSATYEEHGYAKTGQVGPEAPVTFSYDPNAMGFLQQSVDGEGDTETWSHDTSGRQTEWDRLIGLNQSTYLSSYTDGSGNVTPDARPTSVTDPRGATRAYAYDDFGELIKSTSGDWGTQRWHWAEGELTETLWPSGSRTAYSYDAVGRLTYEDNHAENGQLVGQDYRFTYDDGGGSVACGISYPNGYPSVTPCQYRTGRLAKAEYEASLGVFATVEYDYTADGRRQAELHPGSRQTSYQYDTSGRLVRMYYPVQTGDMVRYDYDATQGDAQDQTEVVGVTDELSVGNDYVNWASDMTRDPQGRLQTARLYDRLNDSYPSVLLGYNTDGSLAALQLAREGTQGNPILALSRNYAYRSDGLRKGYTSSVAADPGRAYFYDSADRLTCAATDLNLSSCPASNDPKLVQSFAYDLGDNRSSMVDSTGTTSYDHYADAVYNEYPPGGRTVWYDYSFGDYGLRTDDLEVTSGTPYNTRLYTYDGRGRLRTVTLKRPGAAPGTYDSHLLTILYGPDGRPVSIADANTDTGTERWEDTYWSASARPIERVTTPDTSGPTTYTVDVYADADSAVTGSMRLQYVNGGFSSETRLYALHDPSGLPVEAYQFTNPEQATTELFRATYKPYGDMASSSGDTSLVPWRYDGQIVLTGSQAEVWSGQVVQPLRDPLIVGAARPWDAQVGEHMTPLVGGQAGTPTLGNPYTGVPSVWRKSPLPPGVMPGGFPSGPGVTLEDVPVCAPENAIWCPPGQWPYWVTFPPDVVDYNCLASLVPIAIPEAGATPLGPPLGDAGLVGSLGSSMGGGMPGAGSNGYHPLSGGAQTACLNVVQARAIDDNAGTVAGCRVCADALHVSPRVACAECNTCSIRPQLYLPCPPPGPIYSASWPRLFTYLPPASAFRIHMHGLP